MKKISILFFCIALSACNKHSTVDSSQFKQLDLTTPDFKLSFPRVLWERLAERYEDNAKFKQDKFDFFTGIPVTVTLASEKSDVLKEKGFQGNFGPFGGTMDFADLLNPKEKGHITVRFTVDLDDEEARNNLKVYYVSGGRKRKINGEVIGSGCDSMLDLTTYFQKEVFKNGIVTHTGQDRHVSALSGRYYFIYQGANKIQVAQLTITDSQKTDLLCEGQL